MPMLTATGAIAEVVCAFCSAEQRVTPAEWRVDAQSSDESVFGTPPCPGCGSQEFFSWHDWVYSGPDLDVDHEAFGAQQMALIARVGAAMGRSRRPIREQAPSKAYAQEPTPPDPEMVRARVALERLRSTPGLSLDPALTAAALALHAQDAARLEARAEAAKAAARAQRDED